MKGYLLCGKSETEDSNYRISYEHYGDSHIKFYLDKAKLDDLLVKISEVRIKYKRMFEQIPKDYDSGIKEKIKSTIRQELYNDFKNKLKIEYYEEYEVFEVEIES